MPLVKLDFAPGVDKEGTNYDNAIGWFDTDKVRFRMGSPEKIGGWTAYSDNAFIGICRAVIPWTALSGSNHFGVGTHLKLYVESGTRYYDITPIRASSTINTNPFAITSGSAVVTVTDTGHGATINSYVTFSGATSSDGTLTAVVMNSEYPVDSVIDANSYKVTMSATAAGSDSTEGGGSVVAAYQINVGLDTAVAGTGWGVGSWGSEGWGDASTEATDVAMQLRLWSLVTFGEDLIANIRNGGIYQWDTSGGLSARAVNLTSLSDATGVPTIVRQILMIPESRHLMALGCDPEDAVGTQDTLLIRWADSETLTDWTPGTENTAGSIRLNIGSEIVTGLVTKRDILVWTNSALNIVSYTGRPFFFGTKIVSTNTSIMGPNAAIEVDELTYWMGSKNFYVYDGAVNTLPCTLREHVFTNINRDQRQKVHVGINRGESEVIWFYPTTTDEVDNYVVYNYVQKIWYHGTMVRTVWIDRSHNEFPTAAATDSKLYDHEKGYDDGETNPVTAITAYAESSIFEPFPGDGYQYAFVGRLLPDVTFAGSDATNPAVDITITPQDYPGVAPGTGDDTTVTRSAATPVELHTKQAALRIRGRGLIYRIESTSKGVFWRNGASRIDVRPDGRQ